MSAKALTESGGSLRDRRKHIGLSQQTLADLAGCSISMVRLLERGYEPPLSATRARIVEILDALATTHTNKERPG
jgi:transcriptional regulator with XRE-family HTH domain